jgi:hypothetical protein
MARAKLWSWVTDKSKRVRLIIWLGVVVIAMIGVMVTVLGITSSYWFCANACHKVQDDTIIAYNRAPHAQITCMACHMPVNANAVTFMLHKVEALGELYLTLTDKFELPLNPESEVGMEMPSEICTQCHSVNRRFTFTPGLIMNHSKHAAEGINCTKCHNRTAHLEDFRLVGKSPNGEPTHKHEMWVSMESCFRCHNLNPNVKGMEGLNAPGKCETCHPADFELKPPNHFTADYGTTGHPALRKLKGPEYCYMCHDKVTFCNKCHGVEMPHPSTWQKDHSTQLKDAPMSALVVCRRCHPGLNFCNDCHHGKAIGTTYDPNVPWLKAHPPIVKAAEKEGKEPCKQCHPESYCSNCHVNAAARGLIKP